MNEADARVATSANSVRRGLGLLVTFLLVKLLAVLLRIADGGGHGLLSPFAPVALVYQDVLAAAVFGAIDAGLCTLLRRRARALARARVGLWIAYFSAAAYAAFNLPVMRLFSTPLTRSMLGTAGSALTDSILQYLTPSNVAAMALVIAAAVLVPRWLRVPSPRVAVALAAACLPLLLLGPSAAARAETAGLHRNALVILTLTTSARVGLGAAPERTSQEPLAPRGRALDLGHFAGAARGRNVIWVILESTGAQYLKSYGAELDATPRLTELARRAVVFEHAYTAYPESIKGLYSMLCASYPAPHTNAADYVAGKLPCASIARSFADAGYRTALFHSGRFRYLGMAGIVADRGFDELHDAESIGGKFASSFGTDDASTARRLLEFVDQTGKDRRFFGMYLPISGHHPYKSPGVGPRPFPERSELDHYLNDLHAGDAAFGELVDGIERRGLSKETLWVIVGDHGEAFAQHEGNFAHTLFLYEENVRVPLIVAAPGLISGELRAPQIGGLIDVTPTILDLVGLPPGAGYQGRSLLSATPRIARFFTDHGVLLVGLRDGALKLIHETEHDRSRLFDLDADPGERNDLARERPELVSAYRSHLLDWTAGERARVLGSR